MRPLRLTRRRIIVLALVGATAVTYAALPAIVAWRIRHDLADRGFPDARFKVSEVGLDRLVLEDVELAPGLALGSVDVDAGVSMIWRDPTEIATSGARIEMASMPADRGTNDLPVRTLRVTDGVITTSKGAVAIEGTFDLGGAGTRLIARLPEVDLGPATARDVVVQFDGDRACATGVVDTIAAEVCTNLRQWSRDHLPIAWTASDTGWSATGELDVALAPRVVVHSGHGELIVTSASRNGIAVENGRLAIDAHGDLASLALAGDWTAGQIHAGGATLRDIRGSLSVDHATGRSAIVSWKQAEVGRFATGAGAVELTANGPVIVKRGAVDAYGGRVTLAHPAALEAIDLELRGIDLAKLFAALPGGAHGRGTLDGTLAIRDGALDAGSLVARGGGSFSVGNRAWLEEAAHGIQAGHIAVTDRVLGALADFEYSHFAVALAPDAKTLRIDLQGRGRRIPQELDLNIAVRGLRDAARVLNRHFKEPS